ncbi:MAG: hypothetical protein M1826_002085 [Phylliscum demangeonii]|nr:MAG: hypothetical protein M1826_002085 [Phylliscum demangeonii]
MLSRSSLSDDATRAGEGSAMSSVAHAIRRGSVKISWPLPTADNEGQLQPNNKNTTNHHHHSSSHGALIGADRVAHAATAPSIPPAARPPVRPPRTDEQLTVAKPGRIVADVDPAPVQTPPPPLGSKAPSTTDATAAHAMEPSRPSSRQRIRKAQVRRSLGAGGHSGPSLAAAGQRETKTAAAAGERPRRRGDSVRSVIRRLLRRSTVKDSPGPSTVAQLRPGPADPTPERSDLPRSVRGGGRESQRGAKEGGSTTTTIQDPGALLAPELGARRKTQRSTSLPSLGTTRDERAKANGNQAVPTETEPESRPPMDLDKPLPWQGTGPHAAPDDDPDPDPSWLPTTPTARWHDSLPGTAGTGLAPRPASSYARRAGSYTLPPPPRPPHPHWPTPQPRVRPEDIGLALSHGNSPRRRSRSAGELLLPKDRLAGAAAASDLAAAERRMSAEIRYWRESLAAAQPLSPLSNEGKANVDAAPSRPVSYENEHEHEGRERDSLPGPARSAAESSELSTMRKRVAALEAMVHHLHMALLEMNRYISAQHLHDTRAAPPAIHLAAAHRRTFLSQRVSVDRAASPSPSPAPSRPLSVATVTTTYTTPTPRRSAAERPRTVLRDGGAGRTAAAAAAAVAAHAGTSSQASGAGGPAARTGPSLDSEDAEDADADDDGDDERGPADDDDVGDEDDDAYTTTTTTSDAFITPTEDRSFVLSTSSSSPRDEASEAGADGEDGETTWPAHPSISSSLPASVDSSPSRIPSSSSAHDHDPAHHLSPDHSEPQHPPPPHHLPDRVQRTLSLSQLTQRSLPREGEPV